MLRALFLDFDGPMHPVSAINGLEPSDLRMQANTGERGLFRWLHHLEALLAGHDDVCLVVHSSWRRHVENDQIRQLLGSLGMQFEGVTPGESTRYLGIQQTVERFQIESHLIVDDATAEFPAGLPELVAVHPEQGLDDPAVRKQILAWLDRTKDVVVA